MRPYGRPEPGAERLVTRNAAGFGSLLGPQPGGRARDSSRHADMNEAAAAADASACGWAGF